jgi:hypothetical protein
MNERVRPTDAACYLVHRRPMNSVSPSSPPSLPPFRYKYYGALYETNLKSRCASTGYRGTWLRNRGFDVISPADVYRRAEPATFPRSATNARPLFGTHHAEPAPSFCTDRCSSQPEARGTRINATALPRGHEEGAAVSCGP